VEVARLPVVSAPSGGIRARLQAFLRRRLASSAAWTGQQRPSWRVAIALALLAILVVRNAHATLADLAVYGICLAALFLPYLVGPRTYAAALVVGAALAAAVTGSPNDLQIVSLVLIGMAGSQLPIMLAAPAAMAIAIVFSVVQYLAGTTGALPQTESFFAATFAGTVAVHVRRVAAARQTAMLAELERSNVELRQAHEQLRLDSQRAAELAAAEERERIAREVHDVLAHTLTILVVQVGGVKRLLTQDPERARQQLDLMAQLTRDGLAEVRRSVHALHSPNEDGIPALAALIAAFAERTGVRCTLEAQPGLPALPPALSTALYRVVQEALTNAVRHGNAQRIDVRLGSNETHLVLTVGDDGVGGAAPPPVSGGGNGLPGAGERLRVFGGSLEARPEPTGGFCVRATVPLLAVGADSAPPAPGNALAEAQVARGSE
jgi:signal transduction histidine kinase